VVAALLGMLFPVAAAADDLTQRVEVDGRVVYRIADPVLHEEGAHAEDGAHAEERSVTTAFADVGGTMIDLSGVQAPTVGTETSPADGLPAGAEVLVTIEAPAGLDQDEVVALVAGTDEQAAAGAAQVVDAVATGSAPEPGGPTAAATTGLHQLVVVPVRWTASDAVPTAELQAAAVGTEQYWERQSGARVDIQTSLHAAVTVPRPATCDVDRLLARVIEQTALPVGRSQHVALWFPEHPDCDFAGLADINGGAIWLNGAAHTYVLAHELGHNFGLGHANTLQCTTPGGARTPLSADGPCVWNEYGDNTDVMGQGRDLGSPGSISSGFAQRLGWANVRTVTGPVVTTTAVDVTPLSQTTGVRGVSFASDLGPVFVDYRPAVGADALHEPAWAGVQARLLLTDPVYGYPTSFLLDLQPQRTPFANPSLPVGQTWDVTGADAAVTTTSTGATARLTVGPSAATAGVVRYVTRVYADLFGRQPDPRGLQNWTTKLTSGTPRIAVANSITYSDEYRSRLIAATYQRYLDRAPDAHGAATWLQAMRTGRTIQQMEVGFVASDEYYRRAGGTDAAWVSRLYQHVLGRTAAPAEIRSWTNALARGTSRSQVALGFLISSEHLTTVVDGYYVDLLGRHIDPTGRRSWVTRIQNGERVEAIIGGIIASDEYFRKA
jgi:hypothetical protein